MAQKTGSKMIRRTNTSHDYRVHTWHKLAPKARTILYKKPYQVRSWPRPDTCSSFTSVVTSATPLPVIQGTHREVLDTAEQSLQVLLL